jgi:hypothetical protein
MSILSALTQFFRFTGTTSNGSAVNTPALIEPALQPDELSHRALCRLLRGFYRSNGLYEDLRRQAFTWNGQEMPIALKAIRNPLPSVVDFYAAKLLPDPLVITSNDEALIAAIEQIRTWSNWEQNTGLFSHLDALLGEVFIKTVVRRDDAGAARRVYHEIISAEYVTDFETDERGYLTMVRVDIPQVMTDDSGRQVTRTHTEVWSKADQEERVYSNDGDVSDRPIRQLGNPDSIVPFSEIGVDFVPFVRCVFSDIGDKRGIGAIEISVERAMDADVSATNLHGLIFTDLEGAVVLRSEGFDKAGRQLPAPSLAGAVTAGGAGRQADGSVVVGKRQYFELPGGTYLEFPIPDIDYDAALAILKDHDEHLQQLMPALAYTKIAELSGADLSGRAIRFKLTAAIDQAKRARKHALAALRQAHMQAVTIGNRVGIAGFEAFATSFETGGLDHDFEDQEIIPVSDFEVSQTEAQLAQAFQTYRAAGMPMSEALQRIGYSEERAIELTRMAADAAAAQAGEAVPSVPR